MEGRSLKGSRGGEQQSPLQQGIPHGSPIHSPPPGSCQHSTMSVLSSTIKCFLPFNFLFCSFPLLFNLPFKVHKSGSEFQFFSRSLKPVVSHKVGKMNFFSLTYFPAGKFWSLMFYSTRCKENALLGEWSSMSTSSEICFSNALWLIFIKLNKKSHNREGGFYSRS